MRNYFFIMIFVFIKLSLGQNQIYCNKSLECENCTFCHYDTENVCSCSFENGYCIYQNGIYFSKQFLRNYDGCIENNGIYSSICGNSNIELYDKEIKIDITSSFFSNVLCYYNIINLANDNSNINIRLERTTIEYPKFYLYLRPLDLDNEVIVYTYQSLNSNNYEFFNLNTTKLSLYIDIIEPYSNTLSLYFSTKKEVVPTYLDSTIIDTTINPNTSSENIRVNPHASSSGNIGIIIGIIGGIIIVLIAIVITIILITRYKKGGGIKTNEPSSIINIKKSNEEIENMRKHKKIFDEIFNNKMSTKIYKKNISINNCCKCAVCKDDFVDNYSTIITTKCNHIFHRKCIKANTYRDLRIYPKCPICNTSYE